MKHGDTFFDAKANCDIDALRATLLRNIQPVTLKGPLASFLESSLTVGLSGGALSVRRIKARATRFFRRRYFQAKSPLRAKTRLANTHADVLEVLEKMRVNSPMNGDYQYERLDELANIIQSFRPESVVEYGSGASTAMLAALAHGATKITSIDESPDWASKLVDALPAGLRKQLILTVVESEVGIMEGESVISYGYDHSNNADLVYVDGPYNNVAIIPEHERYLVKDGYSLPNCDVEMLWKKNLYPRLIVIDGRRSTVRRLFLKGNDRYHLFLRSRYMRDFLGYEPNYYLYHSLMVLQGS